MKKLFILLVAVGFFAACTPAGQVRYASSSAEIDVMKSLLKDYVEANWASYKTFYADTAKIRENVLDNQGVTIDVIIDRYKETHEMFSSIQFLTEQDFFEMVVTDEGETWVNYWGVWAATLNATGKRFETPLHVTAQFIDGKIVAEHGYWDNAPIALELYKLSLAQE